MTRCFRETISEPDPCRAVRRLIEGAQTDAPALTFLFVDAQYDLDGLAGELRRQMRGPVLACTTAGHQTAESGIVDKGMAVAAIVSEQLRAAIEPIHGVSRFGVAEAQSVVAHLGLDASPPNGKGTRFSVLLIDGMSRAEERVTALLYGASNGLPLVGGSAGDGDRFGKTYVFDGERFVSDAAVFACVDTTLPHRCFEYQNFTSLEGRYVVTRADTAKRQIFELNADHAPSVYREAIGGQVLERIIVSHHPLLLRWDGRDYARSIRTWDDDHLELFCAIEEGNVVRIGRPNELVGTVERFFPELKASLASEAQIIVGFHCVQRRWEVEWTGEQERYRRAVAPHPVIGFCTYGEQYNGLHMNLTTTGFILGT